MIAMLLGEDDKPTCFSNEDHLNMVSKCIRQNGRNVAIPKECQMFTTTYGNIRYLYITLDTWYSVELIMSLISNYIL